MLNTKVQTTDTHFIFEFSYSRMENQVVNNYKKVISIRRPKSKVQHFTVWEPEPFPITPIVTTKSIPVLIPKELDREIFRQCIKYIVSVTNESINTTTVENPGYPMISLNYNTLLIDGEQLKEGTVEMLLKIVNAEEEFVGSVKSDNTEDTEEKEELDEDAEILEYDDDEELKAYLKSPQKTEYTSIKNVYEEGEEDGD